MSEATALKDLKEALARAEELTALNKAQAEELEKLRQENADALALLESCTTSNLELQRQVEELTRQAQQ